MELDVIAGVIAATGDKIEKHSGTLQKMIEDFYQQQTEAIMLDLTQTGTVITGGSGAGTLIIDLNGPPASYYWVVRGIYLSDSQLWGNTATVTGAQFGKGNIPPNVFQMPAATVRRPFTTLPAFDTFGTNHFNLKHGDRLYAQVQGGTAGQVLQATAYVEQWSIFSRTEFGAGPEAHS